MGEKVEPVKVIPRRIKRPIEEIPTADLEAAIRAKSIEQSLVDTTWFCRQYRPETKHPKHGYVSFIPYDYECNILDALDRGERVIINKSRQIGITTTMAAYTLRACMGRQAVTIGMLSKREEDAKKFIDTVDHMFQSAKYNGAKHLPKIVRYNGSEIYWSNSSSVTALPASPEAGRSMSCSFLICDEIAAWPFQDKMWAAVAPTVSRGGNMAVLSTPQNEGDKFHQLFGGAQAGANGWRWFEYPWTACPEYVEGMVDGDPTTSPWYLENRPLYSEREWRQEFCCEFGHAEDSVFRTEDIEACVTLGNEPYEPPVTAPSFVVGGDIAGGGTNWSVLISLDVTESPARVVEVRGWEIIDVVSLQREIAAMAQQYDAEPWLDRTGVGWGVIGGLGIPAVGLSISSGNSVTGTSREPNVPRPLLINNLVIGLEKRELVIPGHERALIQGLRSYRWDKAKGVNADFVDALAIAWWAACKGGRRTAGGSTVRSFRSFLSKIAA